jgi:hypothetical protein
MNEPLLNKTTHTPQQTINCNIADLCEKGSYRDPPRHDAQIETHILCKLGASFDVSDPIQKLWQ